MQANFEYKLNVQVRRQLLVICYNRDRHRRTIKVKSHIQYFSNNSVIFCVVCYICSWLIGVRTHNNSGTFASVLSDFQVVLPAKNTPRLH